jgi:myo-inositol-1(or 4)-monophosphatase
MDIANLRHIGSLLMKELSSMRLSPDRTSSLGVGAGGDKTFPMDKAAEDVILAELGRIGEPVTVISEEAGVLDLGGGGLTVIIDPVDGSKNAISGIPVYCASVAVASGKTLGDVCLVYIINLVSGDEFWAERGSGAFLNGQRISTQAGDEFSLIAYEAQSPGRDLRTILPLLSRARKTRCFGSIALDLSFLALGAASVFISPSASRSFDFAGGWLMVKEAGGVITDLQGNDMSSVHLGLGRSSPILAAGNSRLHRAALAILSAKEDNV